MAVVFSENLNQNHNNTSLTKQDIKLINKNQNAGLKFIEVIDQNKQNKNNINRIIMTKEYIEKAYNIEENLFILREKITNTYCKFAEIFMYLAIILYIIFIGYEHNYNIPTTNTIKTNIKYISIFSLCYSGIRLMLLLKNTLVQTIRLSLLQDISTLLTILTRSYCHTGEDIYFRKYWDIVNIRNGDKPWKLLTTIYGIPSEYKNIESFYLNLSNQTKNKINLFLDESNALIWEELESFNWKNKRWDKDNEIKNIFMGRTEKTFFYFLGTYNNTNNSKDTNNSKNTNKNTDNGYKPSNPEQEAVDNLYKNQYMTSVARLRYYSTSIVRKYKKESNITIRLWILLYISTLILYFIGALL
jgi:hypothetical protein